MILGEFKCPSCGRVHLRISRQDAEKSVADFEARCPNDPRPAVMDDYLRCFGCGAPASTFVPAGPDDAPLGCTLTCVVVDREHEDEIQALASQLSHLFAVRILEPIHPPNRPWTLELEPLERDERRTYVEPGAQAIRARLVQLVAEFWPRLSEMQVLHH